MEKFNGKYRIPSSRLVNWDYASEGVYFITICTKDKTHFFGECINGKMQISTAGLIVQGCWYDMPNHTLANIILDKFVVMPNHIHGIIIVETLHATSSDKPSSNKLPSDEPSSNESSSNESSETDNEKDKSDLTLDAEMLRAEMLRATSLHKFYQKISPKSGSISRILGSFKSACSKHINLVFPDMNFGWQERFWDNIIRDERGYETISDYIINNPENWKEDKFFNE
ncbi:MAG: hypothetical protein RLZZ306_6 [Bacteroidota bacterium]|jgi:REP element-mobilizing transposase RayT